MSRKDAYQLLTKYISNKNLLKHSLAAEASMKGIYRHLHPNGSAADEEMWGIIGLLHDIDYQLAQETNQLDKHGSLIFDPGSIGVEHETSIPEEIAHAIQAHNFEGTKVEPANDMDWAIAIVDGLTGFIVACALVRPERTLAAVTPETVLKKLGQPAFSRNVRREAIKLCDEKLGIPLDRFVAITLTSMQAIHKDLEL